MAKRQRKWAAKARDNLLQILGGKCAKCGASEQLEFDCIKPQGDRHHKMEWSWRISFYRQQYAQGNIQILCDECQNEKTSHEQLWQETPGVLANPF